MSIRRVRLRDARLVDHHLHIDVADSTRVSELEAELEAAGFGAKPITLDHRRFADVETVGELQLEHGSTIDCGHAVSPRRALRSGPYLVVVAGPDAGVVVPLQRRRPVTIGRAASSDIVLNDGLLSSEHVRIEVVDHDRVEVTDLDSTNGTLIEGVDCADVDEVIEGDYIHIGASIVTVEIPARR